MKAAGALIAARLDPIMQTLHPFRLGAVVARS